MVNSEQLSLLGVFRRESVLFLGDQSGEFLHQLAKLGVVLLYLNLAHNLVHPSALF
jgi:hypothetical protein